MPARPRRMTVRSCLVVALALCGTAAPALSQKPVREATRQPATAVYDGPLPAASAPEAAARRGTVTLLDEGFESASLPPGWTRSGAPAWAPTTERASSGARSAYPGAAPGPYPNGASTWLIYGPMDLADASSAALDFRVWRDTEASYDYFAFYASTNGTNFSGTQLSGSSGGWVDESLDLSGYVGEPDVWIAFRLTSDGSVQEEGAYVDDVRVQKQTGFPEIVAPAGPLSLSAAPGAAGALSFSLGNTGEADLAWAATAYVEQAGAQQAGARRRAAARAETAEARLLRLQGYGPTDVRPGRRVGSVDAASPGLDALRARAATGSRVPVIVELAEPFTPEPFARERGGAPGQRARIASRQDAALAAVAALDVAAVKRMQTVPYLALHAGAEALEALAASPHVVRIQEDHADAPTLAQSTALVGAPAVWGQGDVGAGQAVAILDTGVEADHPFFGGRVASEACYSTTTSGGGYTSTTACPNGQQSQTGAGAGAACDASISGCDHGTHVAGIAAGDGPAFRGVAPAADIIAVQVFSEFSQAPNCNGACTLSYTSDQMLGLERVYALRNTLSIASVNMSLGGGSYTSACDADSRKAVIDNLLAAGIATAIASGNSSYTDAVGAPACISTAVSVGSTRDAGPADAVSSFSNSSADVDLLAPGQVIESAVVGGGYGLKNGTSMAAPHVAGAFALLRSVSPGSSIADLLAALQDEGVAVTDARNGLTLPRIQLAAAAASLGWLSVAPASGVVAPGGSVTLTATADAAGLALGTYAGTVTLQSNDAARPAVVIPASFLVGGVEVAVTLWLEGAYDGALAGGQGAMRADLATAGLVPLQQPFADPVFDGSRLEHEGTEALAAVPPDAVDWVLIELRSGASTVAARRAALLHADGAVTDPGGGPLRLDVPAGSYHVAAYHRNHVPSMTAAPVALGAGPAAVDFGAAAPYDGGAGGVATLAGRRQALYRGDVNADGLVTALDFNAYSAASGGLGTGYVSGDLNLDGLVTALDFNAYSAASAALVATGVPEPTGD